MGLLRRAVDTARIFFAANVSPLRQPGSELASSRLDIPSQVSLVSELKYPTAEICQFDGQALKFVSARIAQPSISAITLPGISENRCFVSAVPMLAMELSFPRCTISKWVNPWTVTIMEGSTKIAAPECDAIDTTLAVPGVVDLKALFGLLSATPKIASFFAALRRPSSIGKSKNADDNVQQNFEHGTEGETQCRHGLKKAWCSICRREVAPKSPTPGSPGIDILELIWPLFQPPPGESLNSRLWFPEGHTPFAFQLTGIKFLAEHPLALLGDEMGLGKSIQAIIAVRLLIRSGKIGKVLIICPKSLLTDWEEKLWDWAPEVTVTKLDGSVDCRSQVWLANPPHHVRIVTYETLSRDIDVAGKVRFDLCILDEGQRIKNPGAGISKACKRAQAERRWVLSGTPLENKLEDLVSLFQFITPGLLQESDAFRPQYVKAKIAPYALRRRKSEHAAELNLPDKRHDVRWLDLLPKQREAYERTESYGVKRLSKHGEPVSLTHVLALITQLKLICNYDNESNESCKLEFISEQLAELFDQNPDEKVLIFSQYPEKTLPYLERAFSQWSPLTFAGSLTGKQRDTMLDRFRDSETHKILLVSLKAGGLGLTLHRANHVYHYDLWWNPAAASQAEDRVHRIGQQRTVFATSFLVRNTIEERIHQILEKKKRLFGEVVDDLTDKDLESKLTEEELFGLFGLSPPRRRAADRGRGEGKRRADL